MYIYRRSVSSYFPSTSLTHSLKLWKREKWPAITCATLHPSPSHQIHLISSHPLRVSVRQLSGLLPVKLHERTGGRTFLPNIALHSGDSLHCSSPSFSPLFPPALSFVLVRSWTTTSTHRLHFHLLLVRRSSLSCNHGKGCLFFVQKRSEPWVISHPWHKLKFSHAPLGVVARQLTFAWPTCAFFFSFFVKNS